MNKFLASLFALLLGIGLAVAQNVDWPPPAGTTAFLGVFNSSAPTMTNGKAGFGQLDINGNLKVTSGGGSGAGVGAQPYNYTPLTPGQYNLSIVSSTALSLPTGALQAQVCASGNNVNYTWDGTTTPTASVGQPLILNQCIQFSGAVVLSNLRFIQATATALLNVGYTK